MRTSPAQFRQHDFRVHTFLGDVPLHDVWTFPLAGGGEGRTIHDLALLLQSGVLEDMTPLVHALFRLRGVLGRLFGWDKARGDVPASSYVNHLTEADRVQSLDEPGSPFGSFRLIYRFSHELLAEIQNGTVHAFSAMALVPTPEGYLVYWAIYVKRVSWLTPWYMACIDPFRRFLVYPAMIKRLQ